jgi:uncharacterized protein with HEPN domain
MSRDKQCLTDILLAIQQVLRYAEVLDRDRLAQDDEKQAAILYRIIVIGEATKRLSIELRSQYSEIPWRQMAGLRDVVIHDYDELDLNILWNVVQINLPDLEPKLRIILEDFAAIAHESGDGSN